MDPRIETLPSTTFFGRRLTHKQIADIQPTFKRRFCIKIAPHKLFENLFEARQLGRRKRFYTQLIHVDLLIIDDLFLRKRIPPEACDDFQEIILDRYSARKSTLITSNRIIEDWGKCLGDNTVASAILDCLLHCSQLLKFEGKSYRLKEASNRLVKIKN